MPPSPNSPKRQRYLFDSHYKRIRIIFQEDSDLFLFYVHLCNVWGDEKVNAKHLFYNHYPH